MGDLDLGHVLCGQNPARHWTMRVVLVERSNVAVSYLQRNLHG